MLVLYLYIDLVRLKNNLTPRVYAIIKLYHIYGLYFESTYDRHAVSVLTEGRSWQKEFVW